MNGTVKTVNERGFGFIVSPGDLSWFYHRSDVLEGVDFGDLREGDEVSFEPVFPQPAKGPRASQVQPVASTAPEPAT